VLRLTERAGRVEPIITAPPQPKAKKESLETAGSLREQLAGLQERYEAVRAKMQPLVDRKSELILQTQQPNFFRDAEMRSATLGEIHNLDQFLHLYEGAGKALGGMADRFSRGPVPKTDEAVVRDKLERLDSELAHLDFVSRCQDSRDLGDALVAISLLDRTGAPQKSVEKLARMYHAFAGRRRLTAEFLGEFYDDKHDRVYLLVAGLGAYALLKQESGLHQVDRRFKGTAPRNGRELMREDRELVRVEIHSAAAQVSKQFRQKAKSKIAALKPVRVRLLKAEFAVSAFDEGSVRSVELWTNGPRNEALERALTIIHAGATGDTPRTAEDDVIRRYDVGLSAKIKDSRTGRTTTRVEQVLEGDLGQFLAPM